MLQMSFLILFRLTFLAESKKIIGEGNGTPLQYSCLENPMDRGAWQAAVHGVAESWTRLSNFTFPGKNTRVGCCFLLQGIFPTQGSNPCPQDWQAESLPLEPPVFRPLFLFNNRRKAPFPSHLCT